MFYKPFKNLVVKLKIGIRSKYTGISSLKQCLIIVAENLKFSIQLLKVLC